MSERVLAIAVLAIALAGCGDDEENPMQPTPNPTYPELSTPQNVLLAYDLAYESRDTTTYQGLYDSSYVGTSVDLNDPGNVLTFTLADEAAHVRTLRTLPGGSVFLDLGPSSSWARMSSDDVSHPDWALIQISGSAFRIEITDGASTYGAIGEAGTFQEFSFEPRLDSASPTDTLWRIVRWRETGRSEPGGP